MEVPVPMNVGELAADASTNTNKTKEENDEMEETEKGKTQKEQGDLPFIKPLCYFSSMQQTRTTLSTSPAHIVLWK